MISIFLTSLVTSLTFSFDIISIHISNRPVLKQLHHLPEMKVIDVGNHIEVRTNADKDGTRKWLLKPNGCMSGLPNMTPKCFEKMRLPSVALLGGTYVRNAFFTCYRY